VAGIPLTGVSERGVTFEHSTWKALVLAFAGAVTAAIELGRWLRKRRH
jgi:hypothetical protein